MKIRIPWLSGISIVALVVPIIVGALTWSLWIPATSRWARQTIESFHWGGESKTDPGASADEGGNARAGRDHTAHAGHNEAASLELSQQALRNVGLTSDEIRPIELQTFRRSITVPAVIVERPGRTQVQVATPMTGVITHVHAVQGEAVEPGTLLFQIRLTHEDLVQAQTDFLKTLGELDVEQREIDRLSEIANSGAIAGKVLLERQYAKEKLTALLRAQRESLRLHGLSEDQVERIAQKRRLLRELQIVAPSVDDHGEDELKLTQKPTRSLSLTRYTRKGDDGPLSHNNPLILQRLDVHKGQTVMAGETLCILADYGELFIEGLAFEQDISQLREASERNWTVDAIFEQPGAGSRVVAGLDMAYLANQVDSTSRTLRFYVRLPNEVTKDRRAGGNRFVEWQYLPGQRLQLRVPVQQWTGQIVLPVSAVAREGAEYFVFQQNGDHFDRVPVHVKYKDQYSAVIENDGSLYPGDVVAMRGAHQLQMALKNKAGRGADPHAGHSH